MLSITNLGWQLNPLVLSDRWNITKHVVFLVDYQRLTIGMCIFKIIY